MRVESDGRVWGSSEVLGLDIWWEEDRLRFWDRVSERWVLSQEEEKVGRLEAEARADVAESRADSAETRAEQEMSGRLAAEARLTELESELQRLRGE